MRQGRKGAVAVIGSGLHHPAIICLPTAVQDPWTNTPAVYRLWFFQIYDMIEIFQACHVFTAPEGVPSYPANPSDIYHTWAGFSGQNTVLGRSQRLASHSA